MKDILSTEQQSQLIYSKQFLDLDYGLCVSDKRIIEYFIILEENGEITYRKMNVAKLNYVFSLTDRRFKSKPQLVKKGRKCLVCNKKLSGHKNIACRKHRKDKERLQLFKEFLL